MHLTSAKNSRLQSIRRAAITGRLTEDGLVVIEGPHLLEEVIRSPWQVAAVFHTPRASALHSSLLAQVDAEQVEVAPNAFSSLASTETSQELLALVRPKIWTLTEALANHSLVIVLDQVQDPGNAGTIVRSAEAFGASAVILLKGCARVFNGKLLRASAGSLFRLPHAETIEPKDLLAALSQHRLTLYALHAHTGPHIDHTAFDPRCAFVVGSEGAGVSPELLTRSQPVSIPTRRVESLNAAMACSIALYEVQRQRSLR